MDILYTCGDLVAYCNKLSYLEREYKDSSFEQRKIKRLEHEVPIWNHFYDWPDSLIPTKGSKLEKAMKHAQNHRESLWTYLQDGRCELSNNTAVRKTDE